MEFSTLEKETSIAPSWCDSHFIRKSLFYTAQNEIYIASLVKDGNTIYIEAPFNLLSSQIKKIQTKLLKQAAELGWNFTHDSAPEIAINGEVVKYFARPRVKQDINQFSTFELSWTSDKPAIFCICAKHDLMSAQLEKIRILTSSPEKALADILQTTLQQRSHWEAIFAHTLDGLIVCDENGTLLFMNMTATKFCGLTTPISKGSQFFDAPESSIARTLMETIETGISQANKVIRTGKNSKRLLGVHIRKSEGLDDQEPLWLTNLRDITASWQTDKLQTMINNANDVLNLTVLSMKNKISAMSTMSRQTELQNTLDGMLLEINRIEELVTHSLVPDKLLDSSTNPDRRLTIRLEYIVNRILNTFADRAKAKDIHLETCIPEKLSEFGGDRDQISQVLSNLIDNAITYSSPQSTVKIIVSEETKEFIIKISDEGCGIPSKDMKRIFDKFVQLNNAPDGTQRGLGMGLSVAKTIADAMGGCIWVKSKPDLGSNFFFSIPHKSVKDC